MKLLLIGTLLIALPLLVLGQSTATLSAPTHGYLFDANVGGMRSFIGVAGSSVIGEPVDLGFQLSMGVTLPDQRNIIGNPDIGSYLASIDMGVFPQVVRPIRGAAKSVSEISLSPHGKAAALSYPSGQLVEVVTGLPNNPSITLEITTVVVSAQSIRRVAVNDDGNTLLLSLMDRDRETIYRWNRTEGYRFLASVAATGALAFTGNSDAVFTDSVTNEVFLAHDVSRQSVTQFIAGPADGVSKPVGVGLSSRNEILVANAGSGIILTFDTRGRILRSQDCGCKPTGLYPIGVDVFRLTDRLNQTIYLFNAGAAGNGIEFVPPLP